MKAGRTGGVSVRMVHRVGGQILKAASVQREMCFPAFTLVYCVMRVTINP